MATNQDSNRRSLYSIIKNEFISVKTNKTLTYDEWFNLFFKNANTLSDEGSTSDKNGTKYNNLFLIINFKKIKSGGDLTIIDYYFKTTAKNSADWRKKLTSKQEFYKSFACDLSWAQELNFCKGNTQPTPTIDQDIIDSIQGNYKSNNSTDGVFIIQSDSNDSSILKIRSYYFDYINGTMTPTQSNPLVFSVSIKDPTEASDYLKKFIPNFDITKATTKITFSDDKKSFTYDLLGKNGVATKIDEIPLSKKTDNTTDSSISDNNKEKQQKIYQNILQYGPDKNFESDIKNPIPCDDFPFKIGCQNKLIGDMNQVLFDDRLNDVFDKSHLYKNLDNHGSFDGPGEKDGEISKNIYNQIMSLKENLRRKTIIKESVKKVLKDYIIKK
jgi:hypothetical protein